MAGLIEVEEALSRIIAAAAEVSSEEVALEEGAGRVLAGDLRAQRSQPPFAVSAMDGFAVRARDVAACPAFLSEIGVSAAGRGFAGALGAGEAVRIATGAPVPPGADAVIAQEKTRQAERVEVLESARPGQFIRPKGFDFREGDLLLKKGRRLRSADIGLAAAMNLPRLSVRRRIRAGILASGDELVPPGARAGQWQIISANDAALKALIDSPRAEGINLGIARDTLEDIAARLAEARNCDVLITIGGVSVGGRDLIRPALEAAGFRAAFHGVAMRPGKPFLFGRLGAMPVLGLPGNPVSALVCGMVFLLPLLRAMTGEAQESGHETAALRAPLAANDARQDYIRARLSRTPGGSLEVSPLPSQDSGQLALLCAADALIRRPPHAPAAGAGERVPVLKLDAFD